MNNFKMIFLVVVYDQNFTWTADFSFSFMKGFCVLSSEIIRKVAEKSHLAKVEVNFLCVKGKFRNNNR